MTLITEDELKATAPCPFCEIKPEPYYIGEDGFGQRGSEYGLGCANKECLFHPVIRRDGDTYDWDKHVRVYLQPMPEIITLWNLRQFDSPTLTEAWKRISDRDHTIRVQQRALERMAIAAYESGMHEYVVNQHLTEAQRELEGRANGNN